MPGATAVHSFHFHSSGFSPEIQFTHGEMQLLSVGFEF